MNKGPIVFGNKKIPSGLKDSLKKKNINVEEMIYIIPVDLDEECRFTKGFVFFGKNHIVSAVCRLRNDEIRFYRGTDSLKQKYFPEEDTYDIRIFDTDSTKEIKIERNVVGGNLVAIGEDEGKDGIIAVFSNRCTGGAGKLCKAYSEFKENGKVCDETFAEEEKDGYCPHCGHMYPDPERKICPHCMNKGSIFLRTLGYLKKHWKKIAVEFLCFILIAILDLIWPYLNGTILYDKVLASDNGFIEKLGIPGGNVFTALIVIVLMMVGTKLLRQLAGIIQGRLTAIISPELVKDMKNDVFNAMGKLSLRFYNSKQTGSLMTRVLGDADSVLGFFIDGLPYFVINILSIVATAVIMFRLNVLLAVVSLIFMPVCFLISWFMLPKLWHRYGRRHRANRTLNSKINDNLMGARVVKAFGQEESEVKRFEKSNNRVRESELAVVEYDNKFYQIYNSAEILASLMVWAVGAYLVLIKGNLTLGVLITFSGYVNQLNGPMDFFSHFIRWYTDCMNAAERIYEIIDAVPDISEKENAIELKELKGDVELRNVTFGYEENKPVLKNVSFKAKNGEMLGIVGRSGAGKTTIVNLISRLYDPDEGQVLIDGIDVRDLSFSTLRGNIAMVSQESYMFMGTVADNIRYARKDAGNDEVVNAAKLAGAHDFICKMPYGYDTIIGSSGRTLSGGEKQRISIARAILCNPKILILDEATSAVDTETEQAIAKSIDYLIKDRTTISIAHRLSTLKDAAHLVVIDDGKVTEEGTHEELTALKGTYYKLRELQTKALSLRD